MFALHPLTWLLIAFGLMALISASVTGLCSAWTNRNTRCRNIAGGPFNRCQHHGGDIVIHDFLGALLLIAAFLTLVYWFSHGGVDLLLADISSM